MMKPVHTKLLTGECCKMTLLFLAVQSNASISIIQPQNHCQSNNRLNSAQSESLFFVNIYILKKRRRTHWEAFLIRTAPWCAPWALCGMLIVLNLLFLVCCIPVVTIGPAITATLCHHKNGGWKRRHSGGRQFFQVIPGKFPPGRYWWEFFLGPQRVSELWYLSSMAFREFPKQHL